MGFFFVQGKFLQLKKSMSRKRENFPNVKISTFTVKPFSSYSLHDNKIHRVLPLHTCIEKMSCLGNETSLEEKTFTSKF